MRGHGQLGLRSGLKDFLDFTTETHSTKDVFAELRPIKEVLATDWALDQGTTFVAPFSFIFDGLRRDVVGVRSTLDTGLTRVESIALCHSTAGSFYYDPDEEFGQDLTEWDVAGALWDVAGEVWDQFPRLYVHLFDNTNPSLQTVVASIGFYYSGVGLTRNGDSQVHPALGPNKLADGDFEDWTEGVPDGWVGSGTSGIPFWDDSVTDWGDAVIWDPLTEDISQGIVDSREGSSHVNFAIIANETRILTHDFTAGDFIAGKKYRISGYYSATSAVPSIRIGETGVSSMIEDGRHKIVDATTFNDLNLSGGEWRRFIFDFIAPATDLTLELKLSGSVAGTARFDDVKVQCIWRYNWYEPRISAASLPSIDTGSNDIFFGGKSIGSGTVSLLNQDGVIERLVAELEWMNQNVLIDAGGQYGDDEEILIDNFFRGFTGLVQSVTATDAEVSFELQDQRVFFHIKLPPRLYDDSIHPTMDFRFQGAPRPLFFGVKENITPVRIVLESSDYGTYEIADTSEAPNGIKAFTKIFAYLTEEDAAIKRVDRRVQLTPSVDFSEDLASGQFTILKDVGPYRINERDRRLDFDEGSSELTAVLDSGLYTAAQLATEIQLQLLVVGTDLTCTYSESDHKFTIAKDSGTLNLLVKTGSNSDSSAYFALGYDKGSDKTGSLSYEAADPTFEEVDRDHLLRVNASGFKDDVAGTFTGQTLGLIETGSDICRVIIVNYMKKSMEVIDETSFTFSRQRAAESLSIYMNQSVSTKDIFDRLEFSNICNIIVNGEGKVFYRVYIGEVADNIVDLRDEHIESFSSSRANAEVFTTIRVKYDQDPTTTNFEAREATDTSVIVRLGRPDIKELETFIKQGDNATSVAQRMSELSRFAARKVSGTSIGNILMRLEVGDKFRLNRRRALSRGGVIRDEIFRLISISKNPLAGRVGFEATDDRVTVASQACIVACQQFCESSCQATCEANCQGVCEINCQASCENSCQVTCEQGCQESCQLGCQETCEVSCQVGCQVSCEAGCQGANCQTNCEAACQTSCETACQTSCEGSCQTVCQQGCQASCEVADQTCVVTCQTNCQGNCQETCENNCQSTCQTSCQSGCQTTCQSAAEEDVDI